MLFGFMLIGTISYSQFSLPSPTEFKVDDLKNSFIQYEYNQENGLLSYIKPKHSYHPTLGAFCVLENKINKKTGIPVKMRLGNVDYVDKLENKRN